jgi:hypothetical protein
MTTPVQRTPEGKAVRLCIGCGQTDDHPRHVTTGQQPWHMDCHAMATGCEVCTAQLAACDTSTASDGVIGEVLQKRLIALAPTVQEG